MEEEEAREGTERSLTDYGVPLSHVTSFKYLGRVLAVENNNCPSVVCNLQRTRQKWAWLTRVLSREGLDAQISNIGEYLLGGGTLGPAIQVRYMGPDTAYAEGAGRIPP